MYGNRSKKTNDKKRGNRGEKREKNKGKEESSLLGSSTPVDSAPLKKKSNPKELH